MGYIKALGVTLRLRVTRNLKGPLLGFFVLRGLAVLPVFDSDLRLRAQVEEAQTRGAESPSERLRRGIGGIRDILPPAESLVEDSAVQIPNSWHVTKIHKYIRMNLDVK